MKTLKLHAKDTRRKYEARKKKVNTKIKSQEFDARIIVNKSLKYISAQVIAVDGTIIAFTTDKKAAGKTKTERAQQAGKELAGQIADKKLGKVVFDRNGHQYHGRVKAFAEGLREGGVTI